MRANPFDVVHADAIEFIADLGPDALIVANDPPWSAVSTALAARGVTPSRVIIAGSMEESALIATCDAQPESDGHGDRNHRGESAPCVVGIGGGTAVDTAKYLGWRLELPIILIPTIASVDATFTDAVGVRRDRKVTYVGKIRPREVVIDLPLITSAPARLNRAGIGDILSCHTGLFDWQLAVAAGQGVPWDAELGELGRTLLAELAEAAADIRATSQVGVGFLLDAYRRIGAACAAAGHSRFEEGSEHFLGYAIEEVTGEHYVHGELIAMGVVAMSVIQGNDPQAAAAIVHAAGTVAHPEAIGLDRATVVDSILRLGRYVTAEGLDPCVATLEDISAEDAERAWQAITALPRA